MQVNMTVNGETVTADVEPRMLLVHFLRDQLRLTGTHWGCDTSNCGTCVVAVDGEPVKSCTMLAAMASGHERSHGRGAGGRRHTRPRAGRVHAMPRAAVRVLHSRHDDHRPRAARPDTRSRRGRRSARRSQGRSAGAPATRQSCGPSSGRQRRRQGKRRLHPEAQTEETWAATPPTAAQAGSPS